MADPAPIRQRFEGEDASLTSTVKAAASAFHGLEGAAQGAGGAATAAAGDLATVGQASDTLRGRLTQTIRELEELKQQTTAEGQASGELAARTQALEAQKRLLAQALANEEQIQRKVTAAIREQIPVEQQATEQAARRSTLEEQVAARTERRGSAEQRLRARLEELSLAEARHQQRLRSGIQVSNEDRAASERRAREIDRVSARLALHAQATQLSSDAIRRHGLAAEEAAGPQGLLNNLLATGADRAAGFVAGFAGLQGVRALYQEWIQDIETANQRLQENARLVRENAEARLDLVALQGVEDPGRVAQLDAIATFAGRRPAEVSRVAAVLAGRFPNENQATIDSLLTEVAAAGQLTPEPLQALAEPLALIFEKTRDARTAGNILQAAFEQAGESNPARLAEEIGKFIAVGQQIGGLSVAQATGFAAAGTSLGLPREVATTGLKNVLFAIRGEGTPKGREVLEREDIEHGGDADVEVALQQISRAFVAGRLSPADLENIGGREAAPVFSALADPQKLAAFFRSVAAVEQSQTESSRRATGKAETLFTPDKIQGLNLLAKQAEVAEEVERAGSVRAAREEAARKILSRLVEQRIEEGALTPSLGERVKKEFDTLLAEGFTVEQAIRSAEEVPNTDQFPFRFRNPITGRSESLFFPVREEQRGRSDLLEAPLLRELSRGPQTDPGEPPPLVARPPESPKPKRPAQPVEDRVRGKLEGQDAAEQMVTLLGLQEDLRAKDNDPAATEELAAVNRLLGEASDRAAREKRQKERAREIIDSMELEELEEAEKEGRLNPADRRRLKRLREEAPIGQPSPSPATPAPRPEERSSRLEREREDQLALSGAGAGRGPTYNIRTYINHRTNPLTGDLDRREI